MDNVILNINPDNSEHGNMINDENSFTIVTNKEEVDKLDNLHRGKLKGFILVNVKLNNLLKACIEPMAFEGSNEINISSCDYTPIYVQVNSSNQMYVMDGRMRLNTLNSMIKSDEEREETFILCRIDYVDEFDEDMVMQCKK